MFRAQTEVRKASSAARSRPSAGDGVNDDGDEGADAGGGHGRDVFSGIRFSHDDWLTRFRWETMKIAANK